VIKHTNDKCPKNVQTKIKCAKKPHKNLYVKVHDKHDKKKKHNNSKVFRHTSSKSS
jgi:hypothetical protein